MAKMINWKTTKEEATIIGRIASRAVALAEQAGVKYPHADCVMDITACHANGNPLDLERLEKADKFNFAHDVFGIYGHINRETGQLEGCFRPRFSKPTK